MPKVVQVKESEGEDAKLAVHKRMLRELQDEYAGRAKKARKSKAGSAAEGQGRAVSRTPRAHSVDGIAVGASALSYSSLVSELQSRLNKMNSDECFSKSVELNMMLRQELKGKNEDLANAFDLMMRGVGSAAAAAAGGGGRNNTVEVNRSIGEHDAQTQNTVQRATDGQSSQIHEQTNQAATTVNTDVCATKKKTSTVTARLHHQFEHPDGRMRQVPPSWSFPKLRLQPMYVYWHCGDESNNIPPAKCLRNFDVNFLGSGSRSRLRELRKVMFVIDEEAKSKGFAPSDNMDHRMANTCYYHGESGVAKLVSKTPSGKPRALDRRSWSTIAKLICKEMRKVNANE